MSNENKTYVLGDCPDKKPYVFKTPSLFARAPVNRKLSGPEPFPNSKNLGMVGPLKERYANKLREEKKKNAIEDS